MRFKKLILRLTFVFIAGLMAFLIYSVGFYQGCSQVIGPNENMGAAMSMWCPNFPATLGELISAIF